MRRGWSILALFECTHFWGGGGGGATRLYVHCTCCCLLLYSTCTKHECCAQRLNERCMGYVPVCVGGGGTQVETSKWVKMQELKAVLFCAYLCV